ncbi:MAG: CRISPR-associated protein Cas4 [Firmicutes bacterium]|nr:CRISPR-associated protein Cas4 [Bacillota bacterium]
MRVSGIHMHYYAVCKRKMWLFDRGITMEHEHDRVLEGKVLHEYAYRHLEVKEILIDNAFKIDAIDGEHVREVKLSSKMTYADFLQMLFYLYQLDLRGLKKKGLISYTKERKTEEVILDEANKKRVKAAIADAIKVLDESSPPPVIKRTYCKRCAYYAFCHAGEVNGE